MRKHFIIFAACLVTLMGWPDTSTAIWGGGSSKTISYLFQDTSTSKTVRVYTGKKELNNLPGNDSTITLDFTLDRRSTGLGVQVSYDKTADEDAVDTMLNVTFSDITDTLSGVQLTEYYTGDSLYVVFKGSGVIKSGTIPLNPAVIGRRVRVTIINPNKAVDTMKSLYVRIIETKGQ